MRTGNTAKRMSDHIHFPYTLNSGITYCLAANAPCHNHEMLDSSVTQGIYNAFYNDYVGR